MTQPPDIAGSPDPIVAAVVITYNSAQDIRDCLGSLIASGVDRILVFDNASTEDQAQRTKDAVFELSETEFFQSKINLGFGAGVNKAVQMLQCTLQSADYIWIVNPDTIADIRALELLKRPLVAGKYDIVSPRLTTSTATGKREVWFDGGVLNLDAVRTEHLGIGRPPEEPHNDTACTFLTGCALLMKVATWRKLGGFSEEYFLYWEDADLSWRATSQGMSMGVVPDAVLWHSVGGSGDRSGKSSTYYYYMQRNRVLFARKRCIHGRLLRGKGLLESIKLTLRPLKQKTNPLKKFASGVRGVMAGMTIPLSR